MQEHGPVAVHYSSDGERFKPFMECFCGWSARESSWEAVGEEFDRHLEEVKP